MALNIRIDIENRYERVLIGDDLRFSTFESTLIDGTKVKLGVEISAQEDPLMPDVYNLAFGPCDNNFQIDDEAKLAHKDHSKVFSTIIFAAFSFLKEHKGKFLGIEGSTTSRAYMDYRCVLKNYNYLNSLFNIYGVNYFIRVLLDRSISNDPEDLLYLPQLISPNEQIPGHRLYNYLIFTAK